MNSIIILHLYYEDLWDEFWEYLKPIISTTNRLIISLPEESIQLKNKLESISDNIECKLVNNTGSDIRPFFIILKDLINSGENIDIITKIHSKKSVHSPNDFGTAWRKALYTDLLIHNAYLIEAMRSDTYVGMIAKKELFIYEPNDSPNFQKEKAPIEKCLKLFNFNKELSYHYVTGTMFMVSMNYMKAILSNTDIDAILTYLDVPHQQNSTIAHGIERIFGYGLTEYNKKIILI